MWLFWYTLIQYDLNDDLATSTRRQIDGAHTHADAWKMKEALEGNALFLSINCKLNDDNNARVYSVTHDETTTWQKG